MKTEEKLKDLTIEVSKMSLDKMTPERLAQEACEMTFLGKSRIPLKRLYLSEHSPVRTQIFWIKFNSIPLFISTHLLRHHVGSVPFQLTCRDDRKGGNVNLNDRLEELCANSIYKGYVDHEGINEICATTDRYTPVNLALLINAQSLIDMSKLRLCMQSHKETRYVFERLKEAIAKVDVDLSNAMVVKCVYRGGICGEPMACGWNKTDKFQRTLTEYLSNFNKKQIGVNLEKLIK